MLRTVQEGIDFFAKLKETGEKIAELWLDFVLSPGSVDEALHQVPGELIGQVYYHSSSSGGKGLLELYLRKGGYEGSIIVPQENHFLN